MLLLQAQVQQLAASALKLLTGEEVQPTAAPAAGKKSSTAAAAAKAPMMDLLIDDSPSSSEPAAAAAAAPASNFDLLGDLAGPPAAPPAAAAAGGADGLFDGLGVHSTPAAAPGAAAPAAAAAASNGDMFGGLTVETAVSEPTPAAPAAVPPQAAAAVQAPGSIGKHAAPLDELFAGLSTALPPAGAPNNSSSSLLSSLSQPQPLQQQQQPLQQVQQDWLGGDLGVPGPKMQQPGPGLGGMQVRNVVLVDVLHVVCRLCFHFQQQQEQCMGMQGTARMQQWPMGQISHFVVTCLFCLCCVSMACQVLLMCCGP